MTVIGNMLSPQSVIDDCKTAHFLQTGWHVLTNLLLVSYTALRSYQSLKENCVNAAKLPFNTLKFRVPPGDLSFVLTNFL